MSVSADERKDRVWRYAEGPARLKAALAKVPEQARKSTPPNPSTSHARVRA